MRAVTCGSSTSGNYRSDKVGNAIARRRRIEFSQCNTILVGRLLAGNASAMPLGPKTPGPQKEPKEREVMWEVWLPSAEHSSDTREACG